MGSSYFRNTKEELDSFHERRGKEESTTVFMKEGAKKNLLQLS
jgi:hypothetical protein